MSSPILRPAHRDSNFAYSFLFLPRPQREAIERVYALCRALDDVSDGDLNLDDKKRRLEFWRIEMDRCYTGKAEHPVTAGLQNAIRDFNLTRTHFEELMKGVEMDFTVNRYPDFIRLSQYCYRVAGVVGLICLEIFGCPDERDYAVALGIALQLTNILRDVKDDARRGRIYLPQDDLVRFGYTEAELIAGTPNERFLELMRFEAERAGDYFRRSADLLKPEHRRKLIASEIMAAVYSALLKKIKTDPRTVLEQRIRVSKARKMALAVRTALLTRIGLGRAITA